ncbi:bifunctional phosphopantothenoylcysteine decarboxylase/phosphopantothenate--cysteine ligase CoaBC [Helicobacter cappadocius]|uniref:Coenzyme A biosynthesis bifunctional protein CoaBC n=1 Tax=Helicobacter cappadocius TaxID=3063998 RepID=A0AA90TBQ1_9HELI|nr:MULTISPECIES: bifunctional phosphopantothenoylcysteine decarboxylase/phosphopantothenate--cysteine ligase CoaBC [unclassified Helicobacter]MDO7253010.1 bifunctional phosphopantothenoylcysteine decarboxylase/phosphopantothenate--cysteine ligase CoaBC [Helicobacter sp. faydin-H75]MDP2539001.1 bifunctional phosphopantothenoylcysteine decarboxylase/phosphopantothenate--cysteine ligase CoaBC [Helicobacter sp. faydin-H76]
MKGFEAIMQQMDLLKDKKILLLVTGSIAAYKSIELASMLKKLGASLRVVMSDEAKKFISPLSFEAIIHTLVLHTQSEDWTHQDIEIACNHISYATWADVAILAPATANTIAKIACGVSDNLILSTLLACDKPKLIAPAMNTKMFEAIQTQDAIHKLKDLGFEIIDPRVSILACDTYGKGAMEEILEIVFRILRSIGQNSFWKDKEVIITGGGSIESIDSVRYISNHSSGLQASYLAIALYVLGARVSLISSIFPIELPSKIECLKVKTATSYLQAIDAKTPSNGRAFLFMAAAISDYTPCNPSDAKLKKDTIGDFWEIQCQKNLDILKEINSPNLFKIGFKAESDEKNAISCAKKLLNSPEDGGKGCEVVCLNLIGKYNPFGSEENEMIFFSKNTTYHTGFKTKLNISFEIADFVQNLLC